MAINDIGFVVLPDGSHYSIAVFCSESKMSKENSEELIAEISKLSYEYIQSCLKPFHLDTHVRIERSGVRYLQIVVLVPNGVTEHKGIIGIDRSVSPRTMAITGLALCSSCRILHIFDFIFAELYSIPFLLTFLLLSIFWHILSQVTLFSGSRSLPNASIGLLKND